ncbi:MAG: Sua5/YciO/YrdC/YwlC family protein [Planctomycetota bacterium]
MPRPTAQPVSAEAERLSTILREGGLLVLPTETVYGVFASSAHEPAVARLRELTGEPDGWHGAWHAPNMEAITRVTGPLPGPQRRLAERYWPGPLTAHIESNEAEAFAERAGAGAGLFTGTDDRGPWMLVRVPDAPITQAVAAALEVPMLGRAASDLGFGGTTSAPELPPDLAIEVVDGGQPRYGSQSSRVRFTSGGGWMIERPGPLDADSIDNAATKTVLFVCTGNTCRSPMAEAIARHSLEKHGAAGIRVASAGTSAGPGAPASPETEGALHSLGIQAPSDQHRSRFASPEVLGAADLIYAMTPEHASAIVSIAPEVTDRVSLLDPEGRPVPDPIGGAPELYIATAALIADLISDRLSEITA